jgi:hypothetical protein
MKVKQTKAQAFERHVKETLQGRKVGRVDVFDDGMVLHLYTGHPNYCGNRPGSAYDKCLLRFLRLTQNSHGIAESRMSAHLHAWRHCRSRMNENSITRLSGVGMPLGIQGVGFPCLPPPKSFRRWMDGLDSREN